MAVSQKLRGEIQRYYGFVPPLLTSAQEAPGVLENLWQQTLWGCINNPLPAMFKETLSAYLSRYCAVPYCIVCHSCALRGIGMTGPQILELLRRPAPRAAQLRHHLKLMESLGGMVRGWPVRGSVLEQSLFQCAAQMFLDERGARQCRAAIRRLLGDALYGQLCSFLSYLRTCHLWTEAHPELSYEQDGRVVEHLHELLREEPRLEEFFSHYRRRRWNPREKRLLAELAKHDQVEQSLRENELRFHHAVRHAPFPIMIYAEDGQVLEVNRAWSEMSGYTLADTPTVATWLGKAQQGKGRWLREDIASLDGWDGIVEEGEYAIKTKVGTTRIWEFSSTILGRLADGRRTVMRAAVDLTERKDLEAALWQTNRTIINLLEAITDGFAALDGQWRFLYLNQQVERLMQHPREELVGRPIWEVLPSFADTEMGIAARRAAADGVVVHGETYYGPTERWLEYHFYPAAEGLSLYLRDVTARHGYEGEPGGRPEAGGGVDWGTTCMLGEGI